MSPPRLFALALLLAAIAPGLSAQQRPSEDPREVRLKILARDARDANDERRRAAWEELLDHGLDGMRRLEPIVAAKLARDRKALEERFKGPELSRARKEVEEALVERRAAALDCIFDPRHYPDEDHGIVGQPEVNRLVGLVDDVWSSPASFARQRIPEVEQLAAALEEDLVYLEASGGFAPPDLPTVADWLHGFDAAFEVERLGITDSHHDWNVAIGKHHADELLTSADPEELACMHATNDYCRKMGVRILEIDERLVRAARKHSQEMHELGYFAHSSPVPENASPGVRCAREGHHGGGAENISGSGSGEGAFWSWYGSSGHHRNMLGGHQQLGVGRGGEYPGDLFTQNFGSGSSLRGRKIDDPQILYLGRLKKLDPASAESQAALAAWCHAQRLDDLAQLHAQRALELDPNNEKAREILDERRTNAAPRRSSR